VHGALLCALNAFARNWYYSVDVCASTVEILAEAAQHAATRAAAVAVAEETVRQLTDGFWGRGMRARHTALRVLTPAMFLLDAILDVPRNPAQWSRFEALRLVVTSAHDAAAAAALAAVE
jgi:hypothetical protein